MRVAVARVLVNALALALTVAVLPGVRENADRPVVGYLVLGAIFGIVNAFLKPAMQFVALPFLLGSLGLAVVVVDVVVFALLDAVTPNLLVTDGPGWIVAAGVLLGVLSFVLDNVLGLSPPILTDEPSERAAP